MLKNYELDDEEVHILDELDGLCGVVQNKETLKSLITFAKLKQEEKINSGNFNIIIRNNSDYDTWKDLLKVCSKILLKYNVITNDNIYYVDKLDKTDKGDSCIDKITVITEDIIVINDRRTWIDYNMEIDSLRKIANFFPNKIFVFIDTSWREGEADAQIGDFATWRLTINKISLEDKIVYCKRILDEYNLKYRKQDVEEFANCSMWQLKNQLIQLLIECKSCDIEEITTEMFRRNTIEKKKSDSKRKVEKREKESQTAKQELQSLIGLNDIKVQVEKIMNYVKLNKNRGNVPTLHMCFTGNPGTGKTSIARIIGKLFTEAKILPGNGEFVEIHGRDLVDQYVGWTAQKVKATIKSAMGGVLFIDEAYSLVSDGSHSFEAEAIATLIKEMEDHRNEICIILAGYTNEMKMLIETNPGFQSRIQFFMDFPDYDEEELLAIFKNMCKKEKYKLSKNCDKILIDVFHKAKQGKDFGNGRYARSVFEKAIFEQADRIMKTNSKKIDEIKKEDIYNAIQTVTRLENKNKKMIGFQV